MAWKDDDFSDKIKGKIRDFVWSNLSSRRFMAQTADLYTDKIFSVIIAMLGGKRQEDDIPPDTTTEKDSLA